MSSAATLSRTRPLFTFALLLVCVSTSIVALANNDIPHEATGFQESGYSLSAYENINLANGNLTFQVPIHTLTTDGGLQYPLAAYFNSNLFFTHRYCSAFSDIGFGSCESHGGAVVPAEVVDGVENFGFGWDLRPWRIIWTRNVTGTHVTSTRVLVEPSGARHKLSSTPPWSASRADVVDPEDEIGKQFYTLDGTNYRLTVKAIDTQERATEIHMEDGNGNVYVFEHIVPLACSPTFDLQPDQPVKQYNFKVENSGLYLTAIERGPWIGGGGGRDDGVAKNRILFTYLGGNTMVWDSQCTDEPWLLDYITNGAPPYPTITFSYTSTIVDDPPPTRTVNVLDEIEVPAFNPALGSGGVDTTTIDWDTNQKWFSQRNFDETYPFKTIHLKGIDFFLGSGPTKGKRFFFTPSTARPMEKVTIPSGAEIEYVHDNTFVIGRTKCETSSQMGEPQTKATACGIAEELPCGSLPPGHPDSIEIHASGIKQRTITYKDASGTRNVTTGFHQGLSCAGVDDLGWWADRKWPYDFNYAVFHKDAQGNTKFYPEYIWTFVAESSDSRALPVTGEIHRFNAWSLEEFSVDYLEGSPLALSGVVLRTADPRGELDIITGAWPADIKVLRHDEIERAMDYQPNWPSVKKPRYSYVVQTRTYTNETGGTPLNNVKACYDDVDPYYPPTEPGPSCTKVIATNGVDKYLNPISTNIAFPKPNVPGTFETRAISRIFDTLSAEDPGDWFLHRAIQEIIYGTGITTTTREWTDLSDTGKRKHYAPITETLNPPTTRSVDCTSDSSDCIRHDYAYDVRGNLEYDRVTGGYGTSFGSLDRVTHLSYRYGVPYKKELEKHVSFPPDDPPDPTDSLLVWERDVDPGTGLPRWHLDGSGVGFAYLWDEVGRVTDIAPVEGDYDSSSDTWTLFLQSIEGYDEDRLPLYGTHVTYVLPNASTLMQHKVFDAEWQPDDIPIVGSLKPTNPTGYRLRYSFDGLGRLTQETEDYPGDKRSRFHLRYLNDANGDPCVASCPFGKRA